MRSELNIFPMFLAALLHVGIVAGMTFAFDWSKPTLPRVPLAIKGSLVLEESLRNAPPVVEEIPEPEPEPEPDNSEQLRVEAEEQKRLTDLRVERERIAREDEAQRQRQVREDKERKQREDAEIERRQQEVERKRLEDVERQRVENERLRKEAVAAEELRLRNVEIEAEQDRIDAKDASALAGYQYALQQAIERNWIPPASAPVGLSCEVNVRQLPGGQVISVDIGQCNGDEAVRGSVVNAVNKASPLPEPVDPRLFERNLRFIFEPTQ
jgi:colicin import membrane protein